MVAVLAFLQVMATPRNLVINQGTSSPSDLHGLVDLLSTLFVRGIRLSIFTVFIGSSLGAGVTLIAFGLSLSTHLTLRLCASLVSFLAATLTLIAFAIDIALYAYVKHQMGKLSGAKLDTDTAPGLNLYPST